MSSQNMALAVFKNQPMGPGGTRRYRHLLPEGERKTLCGRIPDRSYAPFDVWPKIAFQWETCLSCIKVGKARFGGDPAQAWPHHATREAHAEAMRKGAIKQRAADAKHRADMAKWAAAEARDKADIAKRAAAEAKRAAAEARREAK